MTLTFEIDEELSVMFSVIQSLKNEIANVLSNSTPGNELLVKNLYDSINRERIKVSEYFERQIKY
jgi:hypothetical protein|tara:strand:- start:298 stop:492 length:195 start_codon:yes stop_codon:yes gene_type:complete